MALTFSNRSISSLPEELLVRLFGFVDDQSTFAKLVRVTKQFFRIATPVLYSHPCLLGRGPSGGIKYLLPFAWQIIKHPELARYVEAFHIRGGIADSRMVLGVPLDLATSGRLPFPSSYRDDPDLLQAVKFLNECCTKAMVPDEAIYENPNEEAIVTLLLTKFERLKRLELAVNNDHRSIYEPFRNCPNTKMLSEVEDVMISGGHDYPFDISYVRHWMGVLGQPALRRLYARRIGGRPHTDWAKNWTSTDEMDPDKATPPTTFPITHIELRDCLLFKNELGPVLSRCEELETFIYEYGCPMGDPFSRATFNIMKLYPILIKHSRRVLLNLCLVARFCNPREILANVQQLQFHTFERLAFLKISAVLLFGTDILDPEEQVWWRPPGHSHTEGERRSSITARIISYLPPKLRQLHITECEEILTRSQATMIFMCVIQTAPLLGFQHLSLDVENFDPLDRGSIITLLLAMEPVARVVADNRGFQFTLRVLPWQYWQDTVKTRGWGMEEEVRWYSGNTDSDAKTEYYVWNHEIEHLARLAPNGEMLFTPYWDQEDQEDQEDHEDVRPIKQSKKGKEWMQEYRRRRLYGANKLRDMGRMLAR